MALYLLDTNVIIQFLRRREGFEERLDNLIQAGHTLASCAVTLAEVYAGMHPKEERITQAFLQSLQFLPIMPATAELAGRFRRDAKSRGRTLALADTLIAAVAIECQCILLTSNLKDFPMPGLRVTAP